MIFERGALESHPAGAVIVSDEPIFIIVGAAASWLVAIGTKAASTSQRNVASTCLFRLVCIGSCLGMSPWVSLVVFRCCLSSLWSGHR